MGFWIFMVICNVIIPVLMIIFGQVFVKAPPAKINGIYGYRTARSRRNQETWNFAHLCCGRLWRKTGWIMLPASIIGMLPAIGRGDNTIGIVGGAITTLECVVMIATIVLVEKALKRKFG